MAKLVTKKILAGFSLVEMVFVAILFFLIISSLFLGLAIGRNFSEIGDDRIQVQQELRKGFDWITDELREAGTMTIVGVPLDGTWQNSITFQIPASVSGSNIVWGGQNQYFLNNRQIIRQNALGEQRILANDIQSLQFRRQLAEPDVVDVALQGERMTSAGNPIQANLTFRVKLRN